MSKNLVIVESPAKAKTIEGYLGKDYVVKSSYGHVRDLPQKNTGVDVENNFTPTYQISDDKKKVIQELDALAKKAEVVWLATDDDREGEAISWHLKESLALDDDRIKRIVFREITKTAIQKAIQMPRTIDINLVNAQQARRILDRLVGYELSPVLWKKVKRGLSAGRVQSVAVKIIVEREREINKFKPQSSFKVLAKFNLEGGKILQAELPKKIEDEKGAKAFLDKCINAGFTIQNLETKPAKKSPAPPFTTSTLQQEASRKLSFSVAQTMTVAQKLYEAGKITYMRTDSVNLSEEAKQGAADAILNNYGDKYLQNRNFKTKSAAAQEAHEAIRPTNFAVQNAGSDSREQRLYELIWKRAIASQMSDAQLERTTATIEILPPDAQKMPNLVAKGEVIKFEGFLKVYLESTDDEDEGSENAKMLPPLNIGQNLELNQMLGTEKFTRHPARYTEASLVKKLEEMGIGRPSTYAPVISTIQKRKYVIKDTRDGKERVYRELVLSDNKVQINQNKETYGTEKNKLFPDDFASPVTDFLMEHFPNIMDYSFTANVEKEFDEIAQGKKEWVNMLKSFYTPFHDKVESSETAERISNKSRRELGAHPKTGEMVYAMIGPYGAYVQIGDIEEEEQAKNKKAKKDDTNKPQRASLRQNQSLETVTLEDALELFKLPRTVGTFEDLEMKANVGRYGPYILHDKKFYSIPKDSTLDPLSINEEEAIQLIKDKREADAKKMIKVFEEDETVQILNGRWGPYIKVGKQNVKIPKDKKAEELTLQECLDLAEEAAKNPKKKTTKKATKTTKKSSSKKK